MAMFNRFLLALSYSALAYSAAASVVMTGTRVIYPAGAPSVAVKLNNQDPTPAVVQMWVDKDNPNSKPTDADGPFTLLPAVFRVEPNGGQTIRLVFTGAGLPQDKESLFYLNFLQAPASAKVEEGENRMMVMLRNRLKIFYRPKDIPDGVADVAKRVSFQVQQEGKEWVVKAKNPTGYHVNLIDGVLRAPEAKTGGQAFEMSMLLPQSDTAWKVKMPAALSAMKKYHLKFTLINDYGGSEEYVYDTETHQLIRPSL